MKFQTKITLLAVIALIALPFAPALARQATTVKNYFSQCSGAGCDNVLTIGGTFNLASGSTFKVAGVTSNVLQATTAGKAVVSAQVTTVAASDTIVTGLTTVTGCVANLDADPTTDPQIATCSIGDQAGAPAAGSILIKTWKTFGGTPVAATTFVKKVNYVAFGTK